MGTSLDNKDLRLTVKIFVDSTSQMEFSIRNSKPPENRGPGVYHDVNPEGIGLINIKKRLNILYAVHHQLEICEDIDFFGVSLDLSLNHLKKEDKMPADLRRTDCSGDLYQAGS
jgi:hypothetical protein